MTNKFQFPIQYAEITEFFLPTKAHFLPQNAFVAHLFILCRDPLLLCRDPLLLCPAFYVRKVSCSFLSSILEKH